jgi:hypothetical protein
MNWHLPMHHFGWMLVGWEFFSLGDYLSTNDPKLAWLVYLMFLPSCIYFYLFKESCTFFTSPISY